MELSNMGKKELRAACKEHGIKNYSKLTVGGMRDALVQLATKRDTKLLADVFPAPAAPATPAPAVAKQKAPVQPRVEREERNGVKRPLDPTSKTGQVWTALDELVAKGETDLTAAIRAIGEKRGWNRNNTSCELSAYRKFHGIARPTKSA